ncbi:MAG: TonB-dependent receptor [Verrucomicrobia bacterium]|nr:TonB-dependent receptor [Verrucomicrobiota bacterium]
MVSPSRFALAACLCLASRLTAQTPGEFDRVTVTGSAIPGTIFDAARPITALEQPELQTKVVGSLGETLADEPGLRSTSHGPGASRPIIRGLDSNRIRILADGAGVFDVSNTSPDHGVSLEPLALTRIEILRGPAALLYGTNAVGGVVNATSSRIPRAPIEVPLTGAIESSFTSATNGRSVAGLFEGGSRGFNWHLDASAREADDYAIPGFARSAALRAADPLPNEVRGTLPDSALDTKQIAGGFSYAGKRGYLGFSASAYRSLYGVPGFEEGVSIKLNQARYDVSGRLDQPFAGFKALSFSAAVGRYRHQEISAEEGVGTLFKNRGYEARLELRNEPLAGFEGLLGAQLQHSNFAALGEEAFQQPTRTTNLAFFLFQARRFGPVRLELGARYERAVVKSSLFADREDEDSRFAVRRTFDSFSGSLGLVWNPNDDYALAASLSYTQRPPTGQELFADGPHLATGQYEVGTPGLGLERSLALDVSLRKRTGRVTGSISAFYYRFRGYVDLTNSGARFVNDEFDLPVFRFAGLPADFMGFEAEAQIHLLAPVTVERAGTATSKAAEVADPKTVKPTAPGERVCYLELRADYVRAENRSTNEALPRIPPLRLGAGLVYRQKALSARIDYRHIFRQNRVAAFETPTEGYDDLSASVQYEFQTRAVTWTAFVKGTNLTNAEQRVHSSFLKDVTPLPGRGVTVGLRAAF